MSKYDGIKLAEVESGSVSSKVKPEKKRRFVFLKQLIAAACIGGLLFGLQAINNPYINKGIGYIKTAVCWDLMNEKDDLGKITFIEQIKQKTAKETPPKTDEN